MVDNPLFPPQEDKNADKTLPPHVSTSDHDNRKVNDTDLAADIIRKKLATIYSDEPSASKELQESKTIDRPGSKHQQFMQELSNSGKSMADIQTAWHNYYINLPDSEKHQVWREFYEVNAQSSKYHRYVAGQQNINPPQISENQTQVVVAQHQPDTVKASYKTRSVGTIKQHLLAQVNQRSKLKAKHHLQSLGFGLAMGILVVIIFLFGFFNQVIITPFIQPSRHISATPIIVSTSSISASSTPQVIIPKINVEIPVDYSLNTDDESVIENALNSGVVHYPSTVLPGQDGNTAFFGHSSNNIFNPGKYKFAFVLLHTLEKGDTFYLTFQGQVYVYQVIERQIVPPSDVSVLDNTDGQVATATLITCDPPGTSLNRLVVTGQQVSPNPANNSNPSTATSSIAQPKGLASNGPSLWSRFWHWL